MHSMINLTPEIVISQFHQNMNEGIEPYSEISTIREQPTLNSTTKSLEFLITIQNDKCQYTR